jgi:flagellar biosynthetic protein FliP
MSIPTVRQGCCSGKAPASCGRGAARSEADTQATGARSAARRLLWIALLAAILGLVAVAAHAQIPGPTPPTPPTPPTGPTPPGDWFREEAPQEMALSLRILFSLAVMSLIPAALVTMTAFLRIIIVLGFLRSALGTQQTPPNTVLVGLALFLTLFVMRPVWTEINQEAVQPYFAGTINYQTALRDGSEPLRRFMVKQTRERDLLLFLQLAKMPRPSSPEDIPLQILLPGFAISELKSAFQLGFVIYIPFIVLDLVVAGALMSMGMLMLPPTTISLPLKILLFVMIDGWHLISKSLVLSFT